MLRNGSKFKFVKYALLASTVFLSNAVVLSSDVGAIIGIVPGGGAGKGIGSNTGGGGSSVTTIKFLGKSSNLTRQADRNITKLRMANHSMNDLDRGLRDLISRIRNVNSRLASLTEDMKNTLSSGSK